MKPKQTNRFTKLQLDWLKRLESGRYRQGYGVLCEKMPSGAEVHCCLGVAARFTLKLPMEPLDTTNIMKFRHGGRSMHDTLGHGAYKQLNLRSDVGLVAARGRTKFAALLGTGSGRDSLAEYNDDALASFKQIARAIRKMPWAVFTNFKAPKKKGR